MLLGSGLTIVMLGALFSTDRDFLKPWADVANILAGLATIGAAGFAISGINSWQRQHEYTRKSDLIAEAKTYLRILEDTAGSLIMHLDSLCYTRIVDGTFNHQDYVVVKKEYEDRAAQLAAIMHRMDIVFSDGQWKWISDLEDLRHNVQVMEVNAKTAPEFEKNLGVETLIKLRNKAETIHFNLKKIELKLKK
jgi:hypothetical protein